MKTRTAATITSPRWPPRTAPTSSLPRPRRSRPRSPTAGLPVSTTSPTCSTDGVLLLHRPTRLRRRLFDRLRAVVRTHHDHERRSRSGPLEASRPGSFLASGKAESNGSRILLWLGFGPARSLGHAGGGELAHVGRLLPRALTSIRQRFSGPCPACQLPPLPC